MKVNRKLKEVMACVRWFLHIKCTLNTILFTLAIEMNLKRAHPWVRIIGKLIQE